MRLNKKQTDMHKQLQDDLVPIDLKYNKLDRFALSDYDIGNLKAINSLQCIQKIYYSNSRNGWRYYAPLAYKSKILALACIVLKDKATSEMQAAFSELEFECLLACTGTNNESVIIKETKSI